MKSTFPLLTRPAKMYNYAQSIADLKYVLWENKDHCFQSGNASSDNLFKSIKEIGKVFTQPEEATTVDDILEGYQQDRLVLRQKKFIEGIDRSFTASMQSRMKEVKEEERYKRNLARTISPADMKSLESGYRSPSLSLSKPVLTGIHRFLSGQIAHDYSRERSFLESEYVSFIKRFYRENSNRVVSHADTIEEKISEYARLRYDRAELELEVFEGRYMYAEVYLMLRCGMSNGAIGLLSNSGFFNQTFSSLVTRYIEDPRRIIPVPTYSQSGDAFKSLIYRLISCPDTITPNAIISTVEDLLWVKYLSISAGNKDNLSGIVNEIAVQSNKLFVAVLTKQYAEALETLFGGSFGAVDMFFIGRELFKKGLGSLKPYTDLVFTIAKGFINKTNKIELILTLERVGVDQICKKIVEYGMYDVVDGLSKKYRERVIAILRHGNRTAELLSLYYLNDNGEELVSLLEDSLSEEIISNRRLKNIEDFEHNGLYMSVFHNNSDMKYQRVKALRSFLDMKIKMDESTLMKTPLFDETNVAILDSLGCKDKIIVLASEVIKSTNNGYLASKLVSVISRLRISEYARQLAIKNVVPIM